MTEANNTLTLTQADLSRSFASLHQEVRSRPGRTGCTRLNYADQYDEFQMLIQPSTAGFSMSCRLNGSQSYQLSGLFFKGFAMIGEAMLIAADAPKDKTVAEFFEILPPARGRPKIADDQKLTKAFNLRLTPAQLAKVQDLGGADWLRARIDKARPAKVEQA